MKFRRTATLLLLGLILAACSDSGDAIPPALAELHQRAAAGDASAQLELGMRYVTGQGIQPDEQAALRWIEKAAAQRNAAAQFELGSYYTLEPHRDFGRAAALLRQVHGHLQCAGRGLGSIHGAHDSPELRPYVIDGRALG